MIGMFCVCMWMVITCLLLRIAPLLNDRDPCEALKARLEEIRSGIKEQWQDALSPESADGSMYKSVRVFACLMRQEMSNFWCGDWVV